MGSLMSGWSSSVLSDKEVRLMRNRSLTKDEVAAFWRQQQHGRPATATDPNAGSRRAVRRCLSRSPLSVSWRRRGPCLRCQAHGYGAGDQKQLVSSRSAVTVRGEGFFLAPENAAADSSGTSRGWWTRSSSAFLNEPPPPPTGEEVLLGRAQRSFACDPQFHTPPGSSPATPS